MRLPDRSEGSTVFKQFLTAVAVTKTPAFSSTHVSGIFLSLTTRISFVGQAFSQPLNNDSKVMSTKEGPEKEDDSYLGYSVAAGDFVGNGDSGMVVGVPRGSHLLGKVGTAGSGVSNVAMRLEQIRICTAKNAFGICDYNYRVKVL